MAGPGGRREGSGAKKGQHRITVQQLKAAIEAKLGIPYENMLAEAHEKLFNDFRNDINVKEYIMFTENMNKRILEQPVQEVLVSQPYEELSNNEIQDRINNLLTRQELSLPGTAKALSTHTLNTDPNMTDRLEDGSQS